MGNTDVIPEPETKGSFDPRKQDAEDRSGMGALRVILVGFAALLAASIGYAVGPSGEDPKDAAVGTVQAELRDLTVTVTAGGVLRPRESLEMRNKAMWKGKFTITSVVDEGTVITEQDVEDEKVLLTLDTSALEEDLSDFRIQLLGSEAGYQQSVEGKVIQEKQNESNIAAAKLRLKFAGLELARYLGAELAAQVDEDYDFSTLGDRLSAAARDEGVKAGVALQELRVHDSKVLLAEGRLARQEEEVEWTERLAEEGFIQKQKLATDRLRLDELRVTCEAAREERRLFVRYALAKGAEQRWSEVTEAGRALARTEAWARSGMAQSEAGLKSAEAGRGLLRDLVERLEAMIELCTLRAPAPGQVVFPPGYGDNKPISVGAERWPTEVLIIIPDFSSMAARVNVHETDIQKIRVGQRALISLESIPGRTFPGSVVEVSPIAGTKDVRLNPEVKIYETDVAFDQVPEGLTAGMTATAEIIVAELEDVVSVPIEAVGVHGVERFCMVPDEPDPRPVLVGLATEKFVAVHSGLAAGDVVCEDPGEVQARARASAPEASGRMTADIPTFAVRRGPMEVTVHETGAIWSMEPIKYVNEVEGWSQILTVVDNGTVVTQEDVDNGMILYQFDTSSREMMIAGKEIGRLGSVAALIGAQEGRKIRVKQNESDVAAAELAAHFARMDLDAYVGSELAPEVNADFDFNSLGDDERLGGRARQGLRNRDAEVVLAKANLADREETFRWAVQLEKQGYIESSRLDADRLQKQRAEVRVMEAVESLRLFKSYTLPKEAERAYADYVEDERELVRVKVQAESRLLQADATLKAAEGRLGLAEEQAERDREAMEKSIVRATVPGQIVYGGADDPTGADAGWIKPGGSVQENFVIVQMPDLNSLAARVNIPETVKDDVRVGQAAVIWLDAAPDMAYGGKVASVSPMASTEHAELNPDAKVYETDVALDEMPAHFIPGMSAQVEITVADLEDVVHIPGQCVITYKNLAYCWVKTPDGPRERIVEVGHRAETFTEITTGLEVGEHVYLAPPLDADVEELDRLVKDKEAADAEAAAERREEEGESEEADGEAGGEGGGAIDMEKFGPRLQEIQALTGEEQAKKWQELLDSATPDERRQLEAMAGQQSGGGQGGGGAGGGIWEKFGPKLQEMQGLPVEEQAKKWQELLDSATPEERKQLEAMAAEWGG